MAFCAFIAMNAVLIVRCLFACKERPIRSSCYAGRMEDTAAYLVDRVWGSIHPATVFLIDDPAKTMCHDSGIAGSCDACRNGGATRYARSRCIEPATVPHPMPGSGFVQLSAQADGTFRVPPLRSNFRQKKMLREHAFDSVTERRLFSIDNVQNMGVQDSSPFPNSSTFNLEKTGRKIFLSGG
jgi:hypothetical protein